MGNAAITRLRPLQELQSGLAKVSSVVSYYQALPFCVVELAPKLPLGCHDIVQTWANIMRQSKVDEASQTAMCLEIMKCNLPLGHEWPA